MIWKQTVKTMIFISLIALTAYAVASTNFSRLNRLMQHLGTAVLLIPMAIELKKKKMPLLIYLCFALFTTVHVIGAKYVYSYVPYQDWFHTMGWDLESDRNYYDRFVHFLYGLFMFPVFYHYLKAYLKECRIPLLLFISWLIIQTSGMLYELFEWLLAFSASIMDGNKDWAAMAIHYNGQQGDPWDAQQDMAMALLGSTISGTFMWIVFLIRRRFGKKGGAIANK